MSPCETHRLRSGKSDGFRCAQLILRATGYLNADTMAVMQLILSDVFKDFPKLKLIVPHGGTLAFHARYAL